MKIIIFSTLLRWWAGALKRRLYRAKHYAQNRNKYLAKAAEWAKQNRDRRAEISQKYYMENSAAHANRVRNWRERNKRVWDLYSRAYQKNPGYRIYVAQWRAAQRATNPQFKIADTLRRRLGHALAGKLKADTTKNLLGCDWKFAVAHIESLFQPGMSWENHGEWHIDHKRPCASFDLSDPAQQRECFHYTNLQPLWAVENQRKGGRYPRTLL